MPGAAEVTNVGQTMLRLSHAMEKQHGGAFAQASPSETVFDNPYLLPPPPTPPLAWPPPPPFGAPPSLDPWPPPPPLAAWPPTPPLDAWTPPADLLAAGVPRLGLPALAAAPPPLLARPAPAFSPLFRPTPSPALPLRAVPPALGTPGRLGSPAPGRAMPARPTPAAPRSREWAFTRSLRT